MNRPSERDGLGASLGDEVRVYFEPWDRYVWCRLDDEPRPNLFTLTPVDPPDAPVRCCGRSAVLEVRRAPGRPAS